MNIRISTFIGCISFLFALGACKNESVSTTIRAHDPWVFRSVLDAQARMLTLALHDNLWVAYSAQTGALYKVWKGGVNFDGAVYTTVHGPQPSSLGDAYFENQHAQPWTLTRDGKAEKPSVQFRGHRFEGDQVQINYELTLKDGTKIVVREQPEYSKNESGLTVFHRTFTTENLPSDATLSFDFNVNSIALLSSIQTDGELTINEEKEFTVEDKATMEVDATLALNSNARTALQVTFVKQPMVENANKVVGAEKESIRPLGYRLIARNDCKTCHNTYVQTIGPAYVDIAKKYRNTKDNVAMLVKKVQKGGSGVWGEAVMNAHPEVAEEDIRSMVRYIMDLDKDEEALQPFDEEEKKKNLELLANDPNISQDDILPGPFLRVFKQKVSSVTEIDDSKKALYEGFVPNIHVETGEFKDLEADFAMVYEGLIRISKDNNYVFRLISDDGSRLFIGDVEVVNHDGYHGTSAMDGEVALKAGFHPFRLEFFQGLGGKFISLQWKSFDDETFEIMPSTAFAHLRTVKAPDDAKAPPMVNARVIPGDQYPLQEVHPSYDLTQARPEAFLPKVGGMDFLSDGRMVVSTWDSEGGVYLLDGVNGGDPEKITVKKIARGLAEPLGLKVVDDEIYVLQKQELTHLIDHDGDEMIDEYKTLCNAWQVSANFHEFSFGLAYKEGYFYAALAIAIMPGGASANPQIPDRGKAIRISKEDGSYEIIAEGLRTPNGVGIGADGEIFIADNQGDWLPSSKIVHVTKGAYFGSRAVDSARVANLPEKQPVVWLPQDEIGNSPSTPSFLEDGPYKGQMIHGEVTHGGVKRVFVEKVNGAYQGALFRFIQGLEAGVNRLVWGPDGALYVGGIGSTGNWRQNGKLWYGLQRLKYNEKPTFEMLAVRAMSDGVEIEFTQPLAEGLGWNPSDYDVQQWYYLPTKNYGGPKMNLQKLNVKSANLSADRKKVFLELDGMKQQHVIYIHLPFDWTSANNQELWSTEVWYTMNNIPTNRPGKRTQSVETYTNNTLTEAEKAAGWQLLFDGQSLNGWRNFKKQTIGSSWIIEDGAIKLDAKPRADGGWQAADGGDIITDGQYDNFELKLEWKISPCGNSGIIYNVVESKEYDFVWQTGPEMQVLDNTCHPDASIVTHRAGDLYDLIECKYVTVNPAGEWNKVRIVSNNGKLEHWLNGRMVVSTTMWDDAWFKMIANSKFKEMPGFGKAKKGHISLQDHGDVVWYR
ncbi:MAG: family 16 glycoside hydrolase, partial [Bacteroidota bacterium]